MKRIATGYIDSFRGLSREVWWLALITLINRAGTMVIPFLSLYLTEDKGYDLSQVGWVMTCFGLGSVVGTWIGGKLTDIYGYYHIMFLSLISTGVGFFLFQFVDGFVWTCASIFMIMVVADIFRPAMFVALSAYSKPENKTRSVTLIRLAINLGFSAGPAVAGLIIVKMSYALLFWIDGITCTLAGLLLIFLLNPKKTHALEEIKHASPQSAYKDRVFWLFCVAMVLYATVFMQLFSVFPVYFRQELNMNEQTIGYLMALNGILIFIFEMPLVKYLEAKYHSKFVLIIIGTVLTGATYFIFNAYTSMLFAVLGVITITLGEMIALPFSNAFALDRSNRGNKGEYMALYSLSFSIAHIYSHNLGLQLADSMGFTFTWYVIGGLSILCLAILMYGYQRWHL